MLVQGVQESADLVGLLPLCGELGEATPAIVVQASAFGLLIAPMFLRTLPSLGFFPIASLFYQKRAGQKQAGKDVSHLLLKRLAGRVAPGATRQRGEIGLDREREGASRLQPKPTEGGSRSSEQLYSLPDD